MIKAIVTVASLTALAYGSILLFSPVTAKTKPMAIEFVCEEGDDITEQWVGLESVHLMPGQYTSNMWEITSSTGDITYFVQKLGQRCQIHAFEIEPAPEITSTRA